MKNDYTVEVYKKDRRRKSGWKLFGKFEFKDEEDQELRRMVGSMYDADPNFKYSIHLTWVTKKNFLTGEEFKERYDVPYYCSPSSETFWSS